MRTKTTLLLSATILMWMTWSCHKYSDTLYPRFKYLDLPPLCSPFNLSLDKNNIKWIASDRGLIEYSKGARFYKASDGLASDTVWDVATDSNGNVWCVSENAISQFDGKRFITHHPAIGPEPKKFYPGLLMVDSKNNI